MVNRHITTNCISLKDRRSDMARQAVTGKRKPLPSDEREGLEDFKSEK